MSNVLLNLNQAMSREGSPVAIEDRKACVEFTAAAMAASCLPIPSSPVDGLNDYYATHCKPIVEEKLCCINEEYPLNMVAAMNTTYQLWRRRYEFVHPVGCYTLVRYYGALPTEVAESLAPEHARVASNPCCGDIAGIIGLAMGVS